jgi:hypothetical protein
MLTIYSLVDKGFFSAPPDLEYLYAAKPIDLMFHLPYYYRMKKKQTSIITKIKEFFGFQSSLLNGDESCFVTRKYFVENSVLEIVKIFKNYYNN